MGGFLKERHGQVVLVVKQGSKHGRNHTEGEAWAGGVVMVCKENGLNMGLG
ncbi:hypothetical protein PIB30_058146, partial [Stylosanthes scabra]|nr:hypothetical protein [Stylosanthes scabra]